MLLLFHYLLKVKNMSLNFRIHHQPSWRTIPSERRNGLYSFMKWGSHHTAHYCLQLLSAKFTGMCHHDLWVESFLKAQKGLPPENHCGTYCSHTIRVNNSPWVNPSSSPALTRM